MMSVANTTAASPWFCEDLLVSLVLLSWTLRLGGRALSLFPNVFPSWKWWWCDFNPGMFSCKPQTFPPRLQTPVWCAVCDSLMRKPGAVCDKSSTSDRFCFIQTHSRRTLAL